MKKLLYICPHLSTGGQPQYTYKQIQHFIKDFIIEVVEINPSGGNSFVVQKNKIKKIVNLHVLQEDKSNLINIIDEFQPDIIHFQEIPEYNLPLSLLDKIFNKNRKYFIVVTTHGSKTDPSKIVYQPDKYVLVSEWSNKKFKQANLEIPIEVWEYPIEQHSFDKNLAQKYLNLDETYKHVLMVGLFTSGKNQGEIFSIARELEKYKIKFHFVGNQANNHKDYWSPLMKDKPSNCIVWGERHDVDKFYQACDLFYFSSKLELNPLSIKEAISYKMPCIFRKLETYLNAYDDNELVNYIDDDLKNTKRIILEKLNPELCEISGGVSIIDSTLKYQYMIYNNLIKNLNNRKNIENIFDISFVDGPKINISGHLNQEYEVLFIDAKTNNLIYKSNIRNNMWSAASPKYFINWKLQIKNNGKIIAEKVLNLQNKKVKILLDTKCLGDILAYIGSVIEFQKQHKCIVDCIVLNEQLKESISEANRDINFYSNDIQGDYYACYKISYRLENWQNNIPINPKLLSLTQIAPAILDLPKKEYKIKLSYTKKPKPQKPYICIASQSTAQAKYWNNESGWEKLIKYLNEHGYDVWCIDKFSTYGNPKRKINFIPKGAIDKTGDLHIKERMSQISNAEFFIGLGSGLSWLAWNVGVPVVLISGFSEKWAEFETPYRIINENVCHGCWNKEKHTFDRSNWMWCPEDKNFECTKLISAEMVIQKIEPIMKINTCNLFENFDWGDSSENFRFLIKKEFLELNSYKKIFDVESGDIVIDLGASIGPFIKSILKNNPSKCYAVEALSKYIPVLTNNIGADNIKIFNHALPIDNEKFIEIEWELTKERVKCVPFNKFLSENNISKIDFLKCDCEGGEYDVFKLENMATLEKISKIVTEFHINEKSKNKFIFVRDKLLPRFKKYYAFNINGEEITQALLDEELLNYCKHIIVHIDNRN